MNDLQRVLYIDDDSDIRSIVQVALELIGKLDLIMFESGPEALKHAEKHTVDIIMLDVTMPEMDGRQTLRELRKFPNMAKVPTVFITARISLDDVDDYYKHDVVGIIEKPFDPMTLAKRLREIWYSAVQNQRE